MNQPSRQLTAEEKLEIAVKLLSKSRLVRNWAIGEARAYGLNPNSPGYNEFLKNKSRELAMKILKN